MKKILATGTVVLALIVALPAFAQGHGSSGGASLYPSEMLTFGPTKTCATWLSQTDSGESYDSGWMFGFWTGLNYFNPRNHQVGLNVSAARIRGEVVRFCQSNPKVKFVLAILETYRNFEGPSDGSLR